MIPLLLIQIGDGAAAVAPSAEGLQYTIALGRMHFTTGARLHYTVDFGRFHYDA